MNYLKFLLFPEFETPCRIPRLFPIPTHIWKDAGSANITMNGGTGYVLFSPKLFSYGHGLGYIPGAITAGTTFGSHLNNVLLFNGVTPPTGFDQDHVQVIAGVIKVEYVGDLQDVSGRIEVGLAMHDETSMANIVVVG